MAPPTNSHLTTPEAEFLRSVLAQIDQTREDAEPVFDLFRANLDKLNEALLERLPQVFEEILKEEKPSKVAALFKIFGERIQEFTLGNREINIEISIAAYQAALQVFTREAFPPQWAMIQINLGSAYGDRVLGNRAVNLIDAIAAYKSALGVITDDTFPKDWILKLRSSLLHMLENYKIALEDHLLALEGYGLALVDHKSIENLNELTTENLNELIRNLQEAQSRDVLKAIAYVTVNDLLGTALDYRYGLNHDPTDLNQAAAAYQRAAEASKPESDKFRYYEKSADSLYQLGVALTQDGQWYEGLAALETSHTDYREAHSRLGRADALQQMGRTHYLMSNFDKARIYFRDALRLYEAEGSLPGQAACHAGLGRLMLRLNFVDDAIAQLHQACTLYTQLNDQARLGEVQQVYDLAQKVRAKQPLAATLAPPSP
jgi:tetratricopeptide (TPR) repeat protein